MKAEKRIHRFRYRISGEPSKEVIATLKICKKRIKELKDEYGSKVKISKIVDADYSSSPCGAPNV